jgi:putative aldouronate transport system permease protein
MGRRKKTGWFDILNIFLLLCLVIVTLYPFLFMLNVSLSDKAFVIRNEVAFWPKGFTVDNYISVLSDKKILIGYKNTTIYTVLGTIMSIIITAMGAYGLSKKGLLLGKSMNFAVIFTMLFHGGMIPTFLVIKEYGLMNSVWAMVLPGLVATWNLIIMRTFFQGIPKELEESGKMDGLNDIGVFMRIIMPLSSPVLATISLFYAVALWNNFYFALLYLRDQNLYPLQVILRAIVIEGQIESGMGSNQTDSISDDSLKFATIIVATLPILMFYPFIQKHFVKGVMIGSVKG